MRQTEAVGVPAEILDRSREFETAFQHLQRQYSMVKIDPSLELPRISGYSLNQAIHQSRKCAIVVKRLAHGVEQLQSHKLQV